VKSSGTLLEAYRDISPPGTLDLIYRLGEKLQGRSMLHVNSTKTGGGVAEMLHRLIPMFKELRMEAKWEVMTGTPLFFKTTKSFHNSLQGDEAFLTGDMFEEYRRVNHENANQLDLSGDLAVIHDPQPAALIEQKSGKAKWLWRCHIDISRPQRKVWNFVKPYVSQYDGAIFSLPNFSQRLKIPQYLVYPSIDPLSDKNRELEPEQIDSIRAGFGLTDGKPLILQVSRFDKFKDPLGLIEAYKIVRKYHDCRLVLAGGGASDDPEGSDVLTRVREEAEKDEGILVLDLPPDANLAINALQRSADIIVQKSIKEGFGLTVAEGMWKGKPVIGGAVGGIVAQLVYGLTGYTVNSIEGCAFRIRSLLNNPEMARKLGKDAKEYTRKNFLITRHLIDYLSLMSLMMGVR
jgi:trehalose synthase